jgi:nicotinamide phosphoribosyltransferase
MAHLTSFTGTDTIPAIQMIKKVYGNNSGNFILGRSVPATEHSVMCLGEKETELNTFKRLINDIYPTGVVSIVSDTWDYWKVITEYLPELKDNILSSVINLYQRFLENKDKKPQNFKKKMPK